MGKQIDTFKIKRERFSLLDNHIYIIQGTLPNGYMLSAKIGAAAVDIQVKEWQYTSVMERFADLDGIHGDKVTVEVYIPELVNARQTLTIMAKKGNAQFVWFSISASQLVKKQKEIPFFIESEIIDFQEGICKIRGWATDTSPVKVGMYDMNGRKMEDRLMRLNRPDVVDLYKEYPIEPRCGFYIEVGISPPASYYLVFRSQTRKTVYLVKTGKWALLSKKISKYCNKGLKYYKAHGFNSLIKKALKKVEAKKHGPIEYQKWLPKHLPSKEELVHERQVKFQYKPLISIIVPVFNPPKEFLVALVDSVKNQTYSNWELCLSDGSGSSSEVISYLEEISSEDGRVKVCYSEEPLDISLNTNRALDLANGEYLAFVDHDDQLVENALYECVWALNKNRDIDMLYSDEDKMSMDGNKFFQPHFKPDFNIDLLRTVNYICHLLVVKSELQQKIGYLNGEYNGAQDYDFILRCVEVAKNIYHIPKILYHWRSHENSTSENPESKLYAFDAGERAVQAHYDRLGIHATVSKGEYLGLYRTKYDLSQKPLVSIIIPNKDHIEDLERCINSIEENSHYENYEYIIVENNSTQDRTFEFYKQLEKNNTKVRVVYYDGKFNYSKINNFGVKYANGELLWLLNNDTEIINSDCIEELVGYCTREDVGVVGARLYYDDDTIQHAGVVIGFGGIAGHCFVQHPRGVTGYCHRIICAQDYSAVTAACMMVKKSVYELVGGFTEELEVAFNDIDFCMKVRKFGKLVVYNPYAELYHYESKSRGLEDTPEKVQRFHKEIELFEKRWPEILRDGDPYYNPNLTLESQDFSLKRI